MVGKINITYSEEEWSYIFALPFIITKDSSLQWFQYRINHRLLSTKSYLYKVKIADSPLCPSCQVDETIMHMLWDCPETQTF